MFHFHKMDTPPFVHLRFPNSLSCSLRLHTPVPFGAAVGFFFTPLVYCMHHFISHDVSHTFVPQHFIFLHQRRGPLCSPPPHRFALTSSVQWSHPLTASLHLIESSFLHLRYTTEGAFRKMHTTPPKGIGLLPYTCGVLDALRCIVLNTLVFAAPVHLFDAFPDESETYGEIKWCGTEKHPREQDMCNKTRQTFFVHSIAYGAIGLKILGG